MKKPYSIEGLVFVLIFGDASHLRLQGMGAVPPYQDKHKAFDAVWLLQNLKLLASGIDKKQDMCLSTFHALRSVYSLRQQQNEYLEIYLRRFQSIINTAEMLDAAVTLHPGIVNSCVDSSFTDKQIEKASQEKYKAMIFFFVPTPRGNRSYGPTSICP